MAPYVQRGGLSRIGQAQGVVNLRTDLVTPPTDGWPEVHLEVPRLGPELTRNEIDPPIQDPYHSPPPSSMQDSRHPSLGIHKEHGHAVRHRHSQKDAR